MIKKMEGFSKEGNWYKGNLHCHTTDSDGRKKDMIFWQLVTTIFFRIIGEISIAMNSLFCLPLRRLLFCIKTTVKTGRNG